MQSAYRSCLTLTMCYVTCNVFVHYTNTVPALPPLQVCISVALVQCELWLPENPNGSIHSRDQVIAPLQHH
jgi:hypothetical protein